MDLQEAWKNRGPDPYRLPWPKGRSDKGLSVRKALLGVSPSPKGHWVGDGFPVRSLFTYDNLGRHLSPFLLLDYAGPAEFAPASRPRGVGEHPHRGFETVTIVYQ